MGETDHERPSPGAAGERKSNMLVVASTAHFPLFERASSDWLALIGAMRVEIGKITQNVAVSSVQGETLAHHLANLIEQVPSRIGVTHLRSFKRVLLHFEDVLYLDVVLNWLRQFGVKCWRGWKHVSFTGSSLTAEPAEPKPERYVESFEDETLKPPEKPIQMQSPPPSPYEGWIQREEDPPDEISVLNPKALKAVLFDDNGEPVFNEQDNMEEFDLGLAQDDDSPTPSATVCVPNIVVNTVEAESLRQIARDLHQASHD